MPRSKIPDHCGVCGELLDNEVYPFCAACGAFTLDIEDLDLSPNAPLDVIYRKLTQ